MRPALLPQIAMHGRTRPRGRKRATLRRLGITMAALALLWAGGLAWFIGKVLAERPPAPMPHADGIVVLTGGADRVHAGLVLLVSGVAPRLLISGAGAGTSIGDFIGHGIDATAVTAHITLGHAAHSTRGNARETAGWVKSRQLRSLIVVTADYHMPRALLELHRRMPALHLYADPIRPPSMDHPAQGQMLRLLSTEFAKYLVVRLRLSDFAARHIESFISSAPQGSSLRGRRS